METKYYTPSIEEFHVGFEYEHRHFVPANAIEVWDDGRTFSNQWTDWEKSTNPVELDYDRFCISSPHGGNLNDDSVFQYRVKHLDREDIEALSWTSQREHPDQGDEVYYYKNGPFKLIPNEFEYLIAYNDSTFFDGHIKNKSELLRIMKQIGITR